MLERRVLGFRERPRFADVLAYIEEGEPLKEVIPLPKREASIYVNSHYYLDDLPQTEVDETPAPSAGLEQRQWPPRRSGPARRRGHHRRRRRGHRQSHRGLRLPQRRARCSGHRTARGPHHHRPTERSGGAHHHGRSEGRGGRASGRIETFAAEQAAAETAEITATGMATGVGETLAGAAATIAAPEIAIPAAIGLVAGAGGAMLSRSTQKDPPRGSGIAAAASGLMQGARDGAAAYPATRFLGRGVGAAGSAVVSGLMGLGAGFSDGAVSGFGYDPNTLQPRRRRLRVWSQLLPVFAAQASGVV